MKTPIDLRQAKIRQCKTEIKEGFNYNDVVIFTGSGEVIEITGRNNDDGTQNVTYVIKPKLVRVQKSDTEISEPRDITNDYQIKKKSRSQALRHKCYAISKDIEYTQDQLYNAAMDAADDKLEEIRNKELGY